MYQPVIVPGLLQTRDYAAGIAEHTLRAGKPGVSAATDARVARANRLNDPQPLEAHAIVSEAALHLEVGSPRVMVGQCERLLELAQLPNVTIQVLPFTASAWAAFPAPFVLLDYPRPVGNPGICYVEQVTRTHFMDNPDEIADYRAAWDRVSTAALDPQESSEFIRTVCDYHDGYCY
jgi:hypothetical protein